VSDQRQTFSIEAATGRWITPQKVRCRYLEVEPISGAGLYVRWTGPLPPAAAVGQIAQYDGTVPVNARTVYDLGTEDQYLIAVADMASAGFGARLRTDTEPILSTPVDRTFAGTQVTPLPGTLAFPVQAPADGIPFLRISGTGAAVSLTITAPPVGKRIRLSHLVVTWSGATAGAPAVTITDSLGAVVWETVVSVQAAGAQPPPFEFPVPLTMPTGDGSMLFTVAASGNAGVASVLAGVYSLW
jgi:hypothetical protein